MHVWEKDSSSKEKVVDSELKNFLIKKILKAVFRKVS